jgi:capsular polysaccharide biosynthesis protein
LALLRNAFKSLWEPMTGRIGRKLFVVRPSRVRSLVNSDALSLLAIAAGYEVVDPGQLRFKEQVRLFSSASRICGPTGAWLANLAFVPEGARVTVFLPDTVGNGPSMWVGLGDAFGVAVADVLCPVALRNLKYPIHSDFYVPEEVFRATISAEV